MHQGLILLAVAAMSLTSAACKRDSGPQEQEASATKTESNETRSLAKILKNWRAFGPCEPLQCGGNTAQIENAPVNPLQSTGRHAPYAGLFAVIGDQKVCDGKKDPELTVQAGAFVSGASDPCKQGRLVLERDFNDNKARWTVVFKKTGDVPIPARPGEMVPKYKITVKKDEPNAPTKSICPQKESWGVGPPVDGEETDEAILVAREIYDIENAEIRMNDHRTDEVFNIACAGNALAKMRLGGFDPATARDKESQARRQATLKMLTARYCNEVSNYVFTRTGIQLSWSSPPGPIDQPFESYWDAEGALCIDHARLYTKANEEPYPEARFLEELRYVCRLPACDEAQAKKAVWSTRLTDHEH